MEVTRRVHPDIIWGHLSQASQRVRGGLAGEQDMARDMDFSSVASPHHQTFSFLDFAAALVPHRLACAWGLVNGVLSLSLSLSLSSFSPLCSGVCSRGASMWSSAQRDGEGKPEVK